jgi:predicted ATPase
LAESGVNVVMATHSLDMIKALEVHTKGKDGNFIAVNHFTKEGGLLSQVFLIVNLSFQSKLNRSQLFRHNQLCTDRRNFPLNLLQAHRHRQI